MSLVGLSNEKQELENQVQESSSLRDQYHVCTLVFIVLAYFPVFVYFERNAL